jgi:hypothetical protein
MTVKKTAVTKKAAEPQKPASAEKKPAFGKSSVWTLPIAMLMLSVAAAGLWFAMRESSNRTQAATPMAAAVMSPESKAPKAVAPSTAPAPAATGTAGTPETISPAATKPVSITGCLQRNDRGFLLKDTEGADAPKSRSWKSGFIKRSPSSVMLNDKANAAHLASYVGQRVSVTGPLTDREMRVTSLRRVAASCQ